MTTGPKKYTVLYRTAERAYTVFDIEATSPERVADHAWRALHSGDLPFQKVHPSHDTENGIAMLRSDQIESFEVYEQ